MLATADAKIALKELAESIKVQDRKTGLYYNPKEAFDTLMAKPEIEAVFKRLAIR
jgi:hypothetical protein